MSYRRSSGKSYYDIKVPDRIGPSGGVWKNSGAWALHLLAPLLISAVAIVPVMLIGWMDREDARTQGEQRSLPDIRTTLPTECAAGLDACGLVRRVQGLDSLTRRFDDQAGTSGILLPSRGNLSPASDQPTDKQDQD